MSPITATFNGLGTPGAQTFSGYTVDGQVVTVTTTQTISGGNITDSISLSVPSNFIPAGTTTNTGAVINDIELDMGFNNAGTNTLDFTPAITGTPSYAYSAQFATSFTVGFGDLATRPTATRRCITTSITPPRTPTVCPSSIPRPSTSL